MEVGNKVIIFSDIHHNSGKIGFIGEISSYDNSAIVITERYSFRYDISYLSSMKDDSQINLIIFAIYNNYLEVMNRIENSTRNDEHFNAEYWKGVSDGYKEAIQHLCKNRDILI